METGKAKRFQRGGWSWPRPSPPHRGAKPCTVSTPETAQRHRAGARVERGQEAELAVTKELPGPGPMAARSRPLLRARCPSCWVCHVQDDHGQLQGLTVYNNVPGDREAGGIQV